MKTYIIETFGFTGKLTDVYLFLDFALTGIKDNQVQKKALAKWMKAAPEIARDHRFVNKENFPGQDLEKVALGIEETVRNNYIVQFQHSQLTVLNLSLVMICTVLELFFEHVLTLIYTAQPKALLSFSKDKGILLEQFLKSSTYDGVLEEFIKKTTDQVIRQGTMEILKAFSVVGIKTKSIFSWETFTDEVQNRFFGWDEQKLNSIFLDRHSVVHDNALALQSVDDFFLGMEFFEKIILNISFLVHEKFGKYGVIMDFQDTLRRSVTVSNPETYVPGSRI
jgi:hypothetical protein